ncbi:TPA: ribosome rescue GTPase HflX [Legionella pneumophila]|uniref:ribosome rescue GTPase HflX n=1 Tax=Legionella pneumophila TaxID=446 RepID=UPI000486CD0E|nr:ribosome rescue GTPase HflX [Legionella pneumophila]APF01845.1 GTPase HflX [Legionella pneumophila subsp. fraseri]APF04855.1 GTPase HflX [Legionella pneumophila subsp. fraseri]AUB67324.1 GTPase HflX [Legionella pneumophila]AUB70297.1 GTPase HflX [Legionella pneumophila]KXB24957.1 GTPase HflX [Legionella pneumophila]
MFERPQGGERAVLVQLALPGVDADKALAEFEELALSAKAEVLDCVLGARATPDAKYYVGKGKAEEIAHLVNMLDADLVLVNHELSPSQERNLERLFGCRVVDRSGLILDIFAQRARTFEGKLQVELAQLQHLSTRLIRGWTHLERQKGGIGLRGPGETQLETDRRLLRERIRYINKRLEKVRCSRDQNRQARRKASMPTISLVGYTNAGKSTLFNALTGERTYVADQLFATLDPTMRKLELPGSSAAILADTVGFIRDLPHHLVEAFRATLEETQQADLLLHVIDISDPNWRETVFEVQKVLDELKVNDIPVIQVFNKIDLQEGWQSKIDYTEDSCKVWLSATTGAGLDLLKEAIATQLHGTILIEDVVIKPGQAKLRAQLYQLGAVLKESVDENGDWLMKIRITIDQKRRLLS